MWGREGLYGRPRPVPFADMEGERDHTPPLLTSLAPTGVDELSVKLMPIGRPQRAPLHFTLLSVQNCSGASRAPGVLLYFSETFTNPGIFPLIR